MRKSFAVAIGTFGAFGYIWAFRGVRGHSGRSGSFGTFGAFGGFGAFWGFWAAGAFGQSDVSATLPSTLPLPSTLFGPSMLVGLSTLLGSSTLSDYQRCLAGVLGRGEFSAKSTSRRTRGVKGMIPIRTLEESGWREETFNCRQRHLPPTRHLLPTASSSAGCGISYRLRHLRKLPASPRYLCRTISLHP